MVTAQLSLLSRLKRLTRSVWLFLEHHRYEIAVFFFCLIVFKLIVDRVFCDIQLHVGYIPDMVNGTMQWQPNFLYYLTVFAVSFFRTDETSLLNAAVIVLSVAVMLKYAVTRRIIHDYLAAAKRTISQPQTKEKIALLSFLLILAFSLPTAWGFYIGQIPPNVWHNSTVIFLMPFALLLFWMSYKQLLHPTNNRIWIISLLVVVNILIKPNFFLVFVIVYPLLLATRIGLGKKFWLNVLPPAILGGLLLAAQYYFIFATADVGGAQDEGVKISLFSVWSHYSHNIPVSILVSALFPLVYLCFHWRQIGKNLLLRYAVLAYLVALLIYSVLSETGTREFDGNFAWQAIVCSYILFTVVCILLMRRLLNRKRTRTERAVDILIACSFLLHVFFGGIYLSQMLLRGVYS